MASEVRGHWSLRHLLHWKFGEKKRHNVYVWVQKWRTGMCPSALGALHLCLRLCKLFLPDLNLIHHHKVFLASMCSIILNQYPASCLLFFIPLFLFYPCLHVCWCLVCPCFSWQHCITAWLEWQYQQTWWHAATCASLAESKCLFVSFSHPNLELYQRIVRPM